jgi:hypothetical protein
MFMGGNSHSIEISGDIRRGAVPKHPHRLTAPGLLVVQGG